MMEGFDDCFQYRKKNCKLKHVKQWLNLFTYYYNYKVYLNFAEPFSLTKSLSQNYLSMDDHTAG